MLADIGREFQIGYSDVRQVDSSLMTIKFSINKTRCVLPFLEMIIYYQYITILIKKLYTCRREDNNLDNLFTKLCIIQIDVIKKGYIAYNKHIVVYVHNFYYIYVHIFITV